VLSVRLAVLFELHYLMEQLIKGTNIPVLTYCPEIVKSVFIFLICFTIPFYEQGELKF